MYVGGKYSTWFKVSGCKLLDQYIRAILRKEVRAHKWSVGALELLVSPTWLVS